MSTPWNRIFTLVAVGCCLFALTTSAATLDDTVTKDPSDAIDPDWEKLPLGKDDAKDIREKSEADPEASGTPSEEQANAADEGESSDSVGSDPGSKAQSGGGGDGDASGGDSSLSSGQSKSGGEGPLQAVTESWLAGLIDMLLELLTKVAVVLGILLALAGVVLLARRYLGDDAELEDGGSERRPLTVGSPTPTNDVSRAWYALMGRFGLADEHQLTPQERAARAADRGADTTAVRSLTDLFEETTYGEAPVTEERRSRAREWLDRAGVDAGSVQQSRANTTDDSGWQR